MYRRGYYQFEVPPVHTAYWGKQDWINWIDGHGQWLPNMENTQ